MVNNAELLKTKLRNPCATLQEIGNKYGISRERVRQILEPYNLPTGKFIRGIFAITCPQCGGIKSQSAKSCKKCIRKNGLGRKIPIACEECGQIVYRHEKEVLWQIKNREYNHSWCNKKCQGKWLAKHYGFGTVNNPGGVYKLKRKWDYDKVYKLRDETGWSATRIGWALDIPVGTVSVILAKRVGGRHGNGD